jgi:RNA polymerase sigma-70 factor (ECF subfamily)
MPARRKIVHGFILRLVGDPALAEDLVQDTFVRAQKSPHPYRGAASQETWLCAIGLNVVRDHFRAKARRPETGAEIVSPDDVPSDENLEHAVLQAEMSACIGEMLTRLPRPQYDVVALHDKAGLPHGEIADLLGISSGNSCVLLHRGRAALRTLFEEHCLLSFCDPIPCERRPT